MALTTQIYKLTIEREEGRVGKKSSFQVRRWREYFEYDYILSLRRGAHYGSVTMPKKKPERYLKGSFTGLNIM